MVIDIYYRTLDFQALFEGEFAGCYNLVKQLSYYLYFFLIWTYYMKEYGKVLHDNVTHHSHRSV